MKPKYELLVADERRDLSARNLDGIGEEAGAGAAGLSLSIAPMGATSKPARACARDRARPPLPSTAILHIVAAIRIDHGRTGNYRHAVHPQFLPPETFKRWGPEAQRAFRQTTTAAPARNRPNEGYQVTLTLKGLIAAQTRAHFKVDTTPPLR